MSNPVESRDHQGMGQDQPVNASRKESDDGLEDARPWLDKALVPGRGVIHRVKKDGPRAIARLRVGRDGNTSYYKPELGIEVLPGTTIVDAAVQSAIIAALELHEGTPVLSEGLFSQNEAAVELGDYIDFHAQVERQFNRITTGRVDIVNSEGKKIASAENLEGIYRIPESNPPKTKTDIVIPNGFEKAKPLLSKVYNDHEAEMLDFIKFDEETSSADGLVVVGQHGNTEYYKGLGGRIADVDLATAAIKVAALIALRNQEKKDREKSDDQPKILIPVFSGASFHSLWNIPMGDFVTINTSIDNDRRMIGAVASIRNPDGTLVAVISGINFRLVRPGVFARKTKGRTT